MKLVFLDGPLQGQEYFIKSPSTTIGRKREADISLPYDTSLSRFHCQIIESGGQYFIEDMGSGNGTWVNQTKIYERTLLSPPCVFRVGLTHFCLLQDHTQPTSPMPKFSQDMLNERAVTVVKSHAIASETGVLQQLQPVNDATASVLPETGILQQLQLVNDAIASVLPVTMALQQVQLINDADEDIHVAKFVDPQQLMLPVPHENNDMSDLHRLRRRLQVISELAETLVGKLSTQNLLEAVVVHIMSVVPAERGFAVVVENELGKLSPLVMKYAPNLAERQGAKISRTILEKTVRERMALLIYDTQSDRQLLSSESLHGSSIRSLMSVPLLYRDKTTAVLWLDTRRVNAFTQEDLELASVIANQAAVALENAKLYEELQHAYDELRSTQEQLAQAEKISIIGTLSASIAHDINNILTPILGISDLVLSRSDVDRQLKEVFDRQIKRLKAMAKSLLSFARPAPAERVATDINLGITQSLAILQTEARHNKVQIHTRLTDNLPQIKVNPNRLDQVFINLVLNAIQAMSGKGGQLAIASKRENDCIVISFSDNGPGIQAEHLKRLAQPFFTTKDGQGTGLGLFSCKQIIEKEHGGKLEIFSELGKGATFVITLPLVAKN